jgi:putative flippase GtrA
MYKLSNLNIKIRFLIYGVINTLITNIFLQIIILLLPLWISTFLSQIFNVILGFFIYSNLVFKLKRKPLENFVKYFLFSIFTWNLNAFLILKMNYHLNINIRISAILTIPLLAILSFYFQKKIIFKI